MSKIKEACYKQDDILTMFRISSPTLWRWIKKGKFPQADFGAGAKGQRWLKPKIDDMVMNGN